MKKTKKVIGLLLLGILFVSGAKSANALSFSCGACTAEPTFVGYTTAEVSGQLLLGIGGVEGTEKPGFQYATNADFTEGFGNEFPSLLKVTTRTVDEQTYTTEFYGHTLNSLIPSTTYYYRFVSYGKNPSLLENGDLDFKATHVVGETLSFTTKPYPFFAQKMHRGMVAHDEVKNMQETLFILNHYDTPTSPSFASITDGKFGPITESAVKEFQGTHGLVADGIVGVKTREVLNKLIASWFTSCPSPCTAAGGIPFGTGGVSDITSTSATLVGYIPVTSETGTTIGPYYYFQYEKTENYGQGTDVETNLELSKGAGEFRVSIAGLEPDTMYTYRFIKKTGSTLVPDWYYAFGENKTFTTAP